jgi:hypothetical protein
MEMDLVCALSMLLFFYYVSFPRVMVCFRVPIDKVFPCVIAL